MSLTASQILEAALALPYEERSEVAIRLAESVEGFASPEIEAAWNEEIARHIKALTKAEHIDTGTEEVYRQLRADYGVLAD